MLNEYDAMGGTIRGRDEGIDAGRSEDVAAAVVRGNKTAECVAGGDVVDVRGKGADAVAGGIDVEVVSRRADNWRPSSAGLLALLRELKPVVVVVVEAAAAAAATTATGDAEGLEVAMFANEARRRGATT